MINKLGHNYDNGKITKEPTCTTNGEKLFTCKKCGNTKTESINKLNHNFVNGICTSCGFKTPAVDEVYCIYYADGEMTISQNEIEPEEFRSVVNKGFYVRPYYCTTEMTSVRFVGVVKPKHCNSLFGSEMDSECCTQLTEIKNIKNLDISDCTDFSYMFAGCESLTSLDVSHFDTSKVTDMNAMFFDCQNLTNLDVSNFDTSKVENMRNMFNSCKALISLDLSGWNTGKVTDISQMFAYCTNLTSLDLSGWNTGNVTDMYNMFGICDNLKSITAPSTVKEKILNSDTYLLSGVTWTITN